MLGDEMYYTKFKKPGVLVYTLNNGWNNMLLSENNGWNPKDGF